MQPGHSQESGQINKVLILVYAARIFSKHLGDKQILTLVNAARIFQGIWGDKINF
jgi:hypothetical protein